MDPDDNSFFYSAQQAIFLGTFQTGSVINTSSRWNWLGTVFWSCTDLDLVFH